MKKRIRLAVCLCLALALILSGCGGLRDYVDRFKSALGTGGAYVPYADMEYTRPDMTALDQTLLKSCEAARTSTDLTEVLDAIYDYYDAYDAFYTNMSLSYIKYSANLQDLYWQAEYDYCSANYPAADAGLEELYRALAQSPIRDKLEEDRYFGPDFFDAYEGESVWDETFLALLEKESALQNRYYALTSQEGDLYGEAYLDTNFQELAQLLVELVAHRQELAAYMGYDSYPQFAYDFYHYRDYTPQQALDYTDLIRQELTGMYRQLDGNYFDVGTSCTEEEMLSFVRDTAEAMGGYVEEAFELMEDAGLYDVGYGENKLNASFEVYLDAYREPFVFVNPSGGAYDKLVLAHEFGHFAR